MGRRGRGPFLSVKEYGLSIKIEEVIRMSFSGHAVEERTNRFRTAKRMNKHNGTQSPIVDVFLVDRGHKDGPELHCVTQRSIIYILNERKYKERFHPVITVLFARPAQVKRLYYTVGRKVPSKILYFSQRWLDTGANHWH